MAGYSTWLTTVNFPTNKEFFPTPSSLYTLLAFQSVIFLRVIKGLSLDIRGRDGLDTILWQDRLMDIAIS
jgi:hypothetical protein